MFQSWPHWRTCRGRAGLRFPWAGLSRPASCPLLHIIMWHLTASASASPAPGCGQLCHLAYCGTPRRPRLKQDGSQDQQDLFTAGGGWGPMHSRPLFGSPCRTQMGASAVRQGIRFYSGGGACQTGLLGILFGKVYTFLEICEKIKKSGSRFHKIHLKPIRIGGTVNLPPSRTLKQTSNYLWPICV